MSEVEPVTLLHFSGWCAVWTVAYLISFFVLPVPDAVRKVTKNHNEWSARLVCFVHGILGCGLALMSIYTDGWITFGKPNTFLQNLTTASSVSFFLVDFAFCEYFKLNEWDMHIHHLGAILGLGGSLYYNVCGSEAVFAVIWAELSNPFLQIRIFIGMLDTQHPRLLQIQTVSTILFGLSFIVLRVGLGPLFIYSLGSSSYRFVFIAGVMLMFISAIWTVRIVKGALEMFGIIKPQTSTTQTQTVPVVTIPTAAAAENGFAAKKIA
eukprot:GILK01007414.1.p1 GENE.GILK01007414.1~~GILK01007414.1.p1  ORF type:complete len:266 (+),score=37.69 GILK01007414.1:27-824(+)